MISNSDTSVDVKSLENVFQTGGNSLSDSEYATKLTTLADGTRSALGLGFNPFSSSLQAAGSSSSGYVSSGMTGVLSSGSNPLDLQIYISDNGSDLIVKNTVASTFGGKGDTGSGSKTGSSYYGSIVFLNYPQLLGVSLPARSRDSGANLSDSPIPLCPNGTEVEVTSLDTGKSVTCKIVDVGPNGQYKRGIDLLPAVVSALGLKQNDLYKVDYRIINGVSYYQKQILFPRN